MNPCFASRVRFGLVSIAWLATSVLLMPAAEPLTEQQQGYLKQAEAGDARAQYEVGLLYGEDAPLGQNDAEAFKWFLRSAKQGNEDAMAEVGARYVDGRGVAKDDVEGVRWLVKANEEMVGLAHDYLCGIAELDPTINDRYIATHGTPEQRTLFAQAKKGDLAAMVELARCLQEWNGGLVLDLPRAKQLLLDAVAKDYAPACNLLGDHLREQENNDEEAAKLYLKAAQRGVAAAQYSLAKLYEFGMGVPQDEAAAREWYRKSAEAGHGAALMRQAELALAAKDFPAATAWATKADQANIEEAKSFLAGIKTAEAEAAIEAQIPAGLSDDEREWMREAIAGNAQYQYYVGHAFHTRANFPRDKEQMLKWLTLSAEAGNWEAQAELGFVYHVGILGVTPDRAAAEKWLSRAAATGEAKAMMMLGRFYAEDPAKQSLARELLTKVNSEEARDLLTRMDKAGDKEKALQAMDRVADDLAAAMARARDTDARENAVEQFSEAVIDHYLAAGHNEETACEFVFQKLQPHLLAHRAEALKLVNQIKDPLFKKEVMARTLPADLLADIRQQSTQVMEEFRAEQVLRAEVSRLFPEAEAGDPAAQVALAETYLKFPDGRTHRWPHAMHWLELAHQRGYQPATEPLARLSREIKAHHQAAIAAQDGATLLELYETKAEAGFEHAGEAAMEAGLFHLDGRMGVPQDVAKGITWLTRAADKNVVNAMLVLGDFHVTRDDAPIDEAEALKWFRRAADAGDKTTAPPWVALLEATASREEKAALAYKHGQQAVTSKTLPDGTSEFDITGAASWVKYAARLGHREAQEFIATMSAETVADAGSVPSLASDEAAAAKGDAGAMYRLGVRHLNGDGVEKDEARAREWLEKAAALGNQDADGELAILESATMGQLGADVIAAQQSAAKKETDAAASAGPQPGVTIIKIPGEDQAIKAVRYFGGWYVAICEATQKDGVWQAKVWFSRDARAWEHRFTASEPLDDVAYARSPFGGETFLLVLTPTTRFGVNAETTTWCFRVDENAWSEVRGAGARQAVATVGTKFLLSGQRSEGNTTVETVSVSWSPNDWPATDVFAQFKSAQPPPRWDGRQMFDGRVYKSASHQSATWAILSSDDLQNWTEECLIPAPAAGKERETAPQFSASEDMLLAGTMVAMGDGPVRFYRKTFSGGGWERITPYLPWNYLHGLSYAGGRFVAVASREDLRVSKDGLRWKVVATVRPYSPRFAVGPEGNYVFGGLKGAIAIVTPDKSWDDFSSIGEPTIQTGANWENESRKQGADDFFALAAALGASGPNPDAQRFLLQAVAVAETGNPENRLRLGMILIQGSLGVPKDVERGIRLIASSAESGFALARLTYGMALINGANGLVPIDAARGTELLKAAVRDADTADAEAKFQIAALLMQGGAGIPADRTRAFALLGAAADGGFASAQFNYAQALLAGTPEVPADFPRGLEMLKNAANQKVPQAAALLGQIYEAGQGVTADLKEAKGWYALAVNLGFKSAAEALQRVEAKLESDSAP